MDHCWHEYGPRSFDYGMGRAGISVFHSQICCYCGGFRSLRHGKPKGHGPHVPVEKDCEYYVYDEKVDELQCPGEMV